MAVVARPFLVACMATCKQPIKTENLSDHNPFLVRIDPKPRACLQGIIG